VTNYRPFTLIAALLFGLMAALHAYRIATHFQVTFGSHTIPQGVSWIAVVALALMSFMLFKESRR
jgi:hypothetical protein